MRREDHVTGAEGTSVRVTTQRCRTEPRRSQTAELRVWMDTATLRAGHSKRA